MTTLPRFVAPAGTVIRADEVLGWLRDAAFGRDERRRLEEALAARVEPRRVFLVPSARAGMSILLRALADGAAERDTVAIPGYTCYSVAASAARAGLRVRPLDILPETLDFAPDALAATRFDSTVALVGTNLYGIPSDLPQLERLARESGTAFVDDAAQCLDGSVAGRAVGTFGDAGLFSFDKGKNVTSLQGGVIVCRDGDLAERLGRACAALPAPAAADVAIQVAKMLAYIVLLRPWLYWIANRMLRLGETPFVLDAPMHKYPAVFAPLVRRQLARIDRLTGARVDVARRLREGLAGVSGVVMPDRMGARSVYPRFPLVFDDSARRDAIRRALVDEGIGATSSYPKAIIDVPAIGPYLAPGTADTPGARHVAAGILTLPTHAYVSDGDVSRMVAIIRRG